MKLFLGIFLVLIGAVEAQAITARNWQSHPKILEVRAIYGFVNSLFVHKKLKLETKNLDDCSYWDSMREKYTDAKGVVRRYIKSGGSSDSAVTLEHTYDVRGRLRFVLVKAGAVNDTSLELRFYFDAAGKRLWLDRRETGPGYTWSVADFVGQMVWKPKIAFVRASPCK